LAETPQVKFEFSEQEKEILRQLDTARKLRDMVHTEGWEVFKEIVAKRLDQTTQQFLNAENLNKDALWAMQIRLKGIREFLDVLMDGVRSSIETLEPETLSRILTMNTVNAAELDGELGLKEI
jgi:hypothetical protein